MHFYQQFLSIFQHIHLQYDVTYDVSVRGTVKGNVDEFARIVDETLNDSRGWRRAGVKFTRVESGGRLHMILASGEQVRAAAPYDGGCSATLSCTVKPNVLINDDRWMGGSDSYNELGVELLKWDIFWVMIILVNARQVWGRRRLCYNSRQVCVAVRRIRGHFRANCG